ncbi:MAG: twin-arginine translocase subunit TatC [Thaumarchaeota archaeon]|nr:twin-arginine translocase subunit TatC [Nitrososphaerota archaeon]
MSLREHFSELKRRAKIAFLSFVVMLVAFLVVPANPSAALAALTGGAGTYVPLIGFFIARVKLELLPPGWQLIGLNVNSALEIYIIASVVFALMFNSPIFAYEVIMFIHPGLKETERKLIYPFVGAAATLFVGGALFGFFFLAHFLLIALTPFFVTTGVEPIISGLDFYTIVVITVGMSAVAFTIPVYVYTLLRLGIIKATTFTKNRLIIWAITYILCAIITPDGGPLLDVILFVPIIVLLELSVFLGGRAARGRERRRAASEGTGTTPPAAPAPPAPPAPTVYTPTLPSPGPPPSAPTALASSPAVVAPSPPVAPAAPQMPVIEPLTGPPVVRYYCQYCGKEMSKDSIFCPHCGRSTD